MEVAFIRAESGKGSAPGEGWSHSRNSSRSSVCDHGTSQTQSVPSSRHTASCKDNSDHDDQRSTKTNTAR